MVWDEDFLHLSRKKNLLLKIQTILSMVRKKISIISAVVITCPRPLLKLRKNQRWRWIKVLCKKSLSLKLFLIRINLGQSSTKKNCKNCPIPLKRMALSNH